MTVENLYLLAEVRHFEFPFAACDPLSDHRVAFLNATGLSRHEFDIARRKGDDSVIIGNDDVARRLSKPLQWP
jgi:hypothetical protein